MTFRFCPTLVRCTFRRNAFKEGNCAATAGSIPVTAPPTIACVLSNVVSARRLIAAYICKTPFLDGFG